MGHTIQGYIDITLRVPFSVFDDFGDDDELDAAENATRSVMEGAMMPTANADLHEVVGWEVSEAWFSTPEHDHESRCCVDHAEHVMPHRGCILR